MMKRTVVVILSVVLTLALTLSLAACGSSRLSGTYVSVSDNPAKVEMTFSGNKYTMTVYITAAGYPGNRELYSEGTYSIKNGEKEYGKGQDVLELHCNDGKTDKVVFNRGKSIDGRDAITLYGFAWGYSTLAKVSE